MMQMSTADGDTKLGAYSEKITAIQPKIGGHLPNLKNMHLRYHNKS